MERPIQRIDKKRPMNFLTKVAIVCLLVVFICLILILNGRLKNVVVEGSSHYTEEEIKQMLFDKPTDNITLLFYLRQKLTKGKEIPFIQKMDFEMVDKHTIKIKVYEKLVIGCVEVMGGYMYFDKDGIIVESSNERIETVPLILGLKYNQVMLHKPLEVQKSTLFNTILNLTKLILSHELPVQTIQFNSSYEVTLECDGNIVLLGNREVYDEQLAALASMVNFAGTKKYTFDLRNYSKDNTTVPAKPLK